MRTLASTLLVSSLLAFPALADEGMWTFHNPPKKQLQETYGFELKEPWLEHVRLSSVRFNSGGSGSFASPNGLVLTNHHVGFDSIYKLSTKERDFIKEGFYARTRQEELRCPDLELNVLVGMKNVTDRVLSAVDDGMSPEEALQRRRAESGKIEQEAREESGLRSNVVSLYRGGEYWLYQYEQYKDVRLVFAPEGEIGFFGGDPDNFTYPRFNLDFSLFRIYRDGEPVATPHYLHWNLDGVKEGDLVFVSGNPARTNRLQTLSQVEYLRDKSRPRSLETISHLSRALREYAALGEEQERQTKDMLFGMENSRKAYTGELEGLLNESLMNRKRQQETALREAVAARKELAAEVGDAWDVIREAQEKIAADSDRAYYSRLRGTLAGQALTMATYAEELQKPNSERQARFRDSSLDSLKFSLLSPAPVYLGMEEAMLRASLELAGRNLGPVDPFVAAALSGGKPVEVAKNLIANTRLHLPEFRKELLEGGPDAIAKSKDPLIALARKVQPITTMLREREEELASAITPAQSKIA